MMYLKDIQKKIKEFTTKNNLESNVEIRILDLVSEVGELSKEIIKASDYGTKEFKVTENLEYELGDVLFVTLIIANKLNIDIETALEKVLNKYEKRLNKGGIGSENE
jgi:NTP pyrophosphatase (non-canonical NTP hydrolase)